MEVKTVVARTTPTLLRCFSSTTATNSSPTKPEAADKKSILHFDNAVKHCTAEVKKFDFYAFINGQYMPKTTQPYYFGNYALFLEALKSREISREQSICQTRLNWWMQVVSDVKNDKRAREPVSVVLSQAKKKTNINLDLVERIVDFQLFDIDRGDMQTMTELEVYAENTRSLLLYLNLHLLKIDDPNALTAASHIGRALGICDVIKKLPFYLGVHRGYLPQDVLLKVSVF